MKKNLLTSLLIAAIFQCSVAQKTKIEYRPVTETNLEESFPLATSFIMRDLNLGIFEFNYGARIIKSTYFEYYRGITKHRGRWQFTIDTNGTLEIQIVDIQWWVGSESVWKNSSESLFSKKEKNLRAAFANDMRTGLSSQEQVKSAQIWFYGSLDVNRKFYETSTDLAGERWFKSNLQDRQITWELTFIDIEKSGESNYLYKEQFSYAIELSLGSISFEDNKFFITKFTNNDKNALTQKGDKINVSGYCRSLSYEDEKFYVILTDELEDELPKNTLAVQREKDSSEISIIEVADQLKKLKELLDLGAITEDEYSQEKAKLLNK